MSHVSSRTRDRKGFRELFLHTQDRVRERCRHWLSEQEYREMSALVTRKQGTFIIRQTNTRSIWLLSMPFGELYVVYNRTLNLVCTVLEPYMVEQYLREAANPQEEEDEFAPAF